MEGPKHPKEELPEVTTTPNPPLDAHPDSIGATTTDTTKGPMQETPHEEPTQEAAHTEEGPQTERTTTAERAEEVPQNEQMQEVEPKPIEPIGPLEPKSTEHTDPPEPETTEPTSPLEPVPTTQTMTPPRAPTVVLVEMDHPEPNILDIFDD